MVSGHRKTSMIIGPFAVIMGIALATATPTRAASSCSSQQFITDECTRQPTIIDLEVGDSHVRTKVDASTPADAVRLITEHGTRFPGDRVHVDVQRPGGGGRATPQQAVDQDGGQDLSQGRSFELPMHCRRDDYAFLPADAQGGLPCAGLRLDVSPSIDPDAVAGRMVQAVHLPPIKLGMNPRRGLVRLPTWFWVEGYDGGLLGDAKSLELVKRRCQLVVERDERGDVVLNEDGTPQVDERCSTSTQHLTVEVRLWPTAYAWDFGDGHSRRLPCAGVGACPDGLGRRYTDPETPSPIRHAYVWTSLGQNGDEDAYTIGLQVDFGAQYRVSLDGQLVADWQSVPGGERSGHWTAKHQVQQVQAVLGPPRTPVPAPEPPDD